MDGACAAVVILIGKIQGRQGVRISPDFPALSGRTPDRVAGYGF